MAKAKSTKKAARPRGRSEEKGGELAEQLREAVRSTGKSIYAVAGEVGMPEPVLNRFMRGERDIRLETASKLARYFGMELTRTKQAKQGRRE